MSLRIGQVLLNGNKWKYRLVKQLGVGDKTVTSHVFKAEVLPGVESVVDPRKQWVVVRKTHPTRWKSLRREYKQHVKPYIQTSTYFRQIQDTINLDGASTLSPETPCCLVLEWMETTLAQLPSESYYQNPLIVYKVFEALLEGSAQLARYGQVHSDFKPANILISAIDGSSPPNVKIGDLGLGNVQRALESAADRAGLMYNNHSEVGPEGSNEGWLQPSAFRAPEVWTGVRCYHKADVLQWIDPDLLGINDIEPPFPPMTWCLAKIMRLFDRDATLVPPPADAPQDLHRCFQWARQLVVAPRQDHPGELILQTPSYELWAGVALGQGVPREVLDMIRFLAVPDPEERPSALEAPASREFRALKSAANSWMLSINGR